MSEGNWAFVVWLLSAAVIAPLALRQFSRRYGNLARKTPQSDERTQDRPLQ